MKWTTSFDFKREARWLLILVTVPFLLALFVLLVWPWLRQLAVLIPDSWTK